MRETTKSVTPRREFLKKTAAAIAQLLPLNEAAETAAQKLIAAVTNLRKANARVENAETDAKTKAAEIAKRTAKAELEAVGKSVKIASPEVVTVM